jgi:hypothetical protein
VPEGARKRPWRLVFEPAVSEIADQNRLSKITSSVPYSAGKVENDFRTKLSYLQEGDAVYYVVGEMADRTRRYRIGKIVLGATPEPSQFADRIYFVRHKFDLARARHQDDTGYLADPEPAKKRRK